MKLANSANCKYCSVIDHAEHFFFQCNKVKPLWAEVQKDIKTKIGVTLVITVEKVLLGVPHISGINQSCLKKINTILAIGKMAISKFKYGKQRNILEIYETDCNLRKVWLTANA